MIMGYAGTLCVSSEAASICHHPPSTACQMCGLRCCETLDRHCRSFGEEEALQERGPSTAASQGMVNRMIHAVNSNALTTLVSAKTPGTVNPFVVSAATGRVQFTHCAILCPEHPLSAYATGAEGATSSSLRSRGSEPRHSGMPFENMLPPESRASYTFWKSSSGYAIRQSSPVLDRTTRSAVPGAGTLNRILSPEHSAATPGRPRSVQKVRNPPQWQPLHILRNLFCKYAVALRSAAWHCIISCCPVLGVKLPAFALLMQQKGSIADPIPEASMERLFRTAMGTQVLSSNLLCSNMDLNSRIWSMEQGLLAY